MDGPLPTPNCLRNYWLLPVRKFHNYIYSLRSFIKKRTVIKNDIFIYDDGKFTLVGCDMIKVNALKDKFQISGFDPSAPTLILTECSTTYIHADQCENLLTMLTDYLKNFVYISYEQIRQEVSFFSVS